MTETLDPVATKDKGFSGLGRMDDADQELLGVPSVRSRPNVSLAEPIATVLERNPFSFTKEEFSSLDPAIQDGVSIQLMRQIPIEALRHGNNPGEQKTPAQLKLEEINPILEVQYPISEPERIEFDNWERYITNGWTGVNPDILETWDSMGVTTLLDQERVRREGKAIEGVQGKSVEGFKIGRFRRYEMQRQIEAELQTAEKVDLPKAA